MIMICEIQDGVLFIIKLLSNEGMNDYLSQSAKFSYFIPDLVGLSFLPLTLFTG